MTPHNEANKNEIAKTVVMPGDPLRAKFIAQTYLKDYKLVNSVRNMLAYTGYYKNKLVTIMASGMGMPSIGIYSYELYKFYEVENIIRVGSAGAYTKDLNLYDIVLVDGSYSDSTFAKMQNGCNDKVLYSSKEINACLKSAAKELSIPLNFNNIYSSDVFYKENDNYEEILKNYKCLACEMESFALFHNANVLNKKASCLLTISDSLVTKESTTSIERQNNFKKMVEIALEAIINL